MMINVAKRGLWLLSALLVAAYVATELPALSDVPPGSGGSNGTIVLPPNDSTVIAPTSTPNTTTATKVTSPVPTFNTTAIVSSPTTSSNVTTTTNGSTSVTTHPTTHSTATSISVPTKPASVTSTSSSATVTATPASESQKRDSKFDAGSFVGGIVLTLGVLIVLYMGCKFYASKRGVQYRTIDEHEAII